jgi:murein DD-endopeptidase MepM/ murein hydrolase activator NlpD
MEVKMDRKYTKNHKAVAFLKRNIYYIIMLVCLAAIATMVTIALINKSKTPPADGPVVQVPDGDDDTIIPDEDPPILDPIVFASPVVNANIIRDFTIDTLVYHNTLNEWRVNTGIDFGGEDGDVVAAAYDGVVESVSSDEFYGHKVVIKHNDELRTIYYSLNEPSVTEGQTVTKGQSIGTMGATAAKHILDGPMVHFEVTLNNKAVDPYEYLDIGDK